MFLVVIIILLYAKTSKQVYEHRSPIVRASGCFFVSVVLRSLARKHRCDVKKQSQTSSEKYYGKRRKGYEFKRTWKYFVKSGLTTSSSNERLTNEECLNV